MSPTPQFQCPKCGRVSYNPNDAFHRYCGACHSFFNADGEDESLSVIWSIFENTTDAPGKFVARRFFASARGVQPDIGFTEDTIEQARARIPPGLVRIPPQPGELPTVVESYI